MQTSKMHFLLIVIIAFSSWKCTNEPGDTHSNNQAITAMSYNIKYDDQSDSPTGWQQRRQRLTNLVSFYEPDFLGTQEGLLHQLEFMQANLDSMEWIGVARADGKSEGEFSALFYNAKRFTLVANSDSTLWLSKTPGKPSKNWDAALPRILTWGKFRNKQTEQELFVFNTHFDHVGDTARAESAKLILKTIEQVTGNLPVILTGDFNFTPDAEPYAILTDNSGLNDSHVIAEANHIGPPFTYSGFKVDPGIEPRRIDYIFINDHFITGKHGAISDFYNGYYPSDHLPVISEFILSTTNSTDE